MQRKPRKREAAPFSKGGYDYGYITDRGLELLRSAIENGERVHPDDKRAVRRRIEEPPRGIDGALLDPAVSNFVVWAIGRYGSLDQIFGRQEQAELTPRQRKQLGAMRARHTKQIRAIERARTVMIAREKMIWATSSKKEPSNGQLARKVGMSVSGVRRILEKYKDLMKDS